MRCLVVGSAKSGTTALLYAIARALGEPRIYFEERIPALGQLPPNAVAKIILEHEDANDVREIARSFDKTVLLVRDPRDNAISRLLYVVGQKKGLLGDEAFLTKLAELVRQKQENPRSITLERLVDLFGSDVDSLNTTIKYNQDLADFYAQLPEGWLVLRYEDLVAGRLEDLSRYLGIQVEPDAPIAANLSRVTRTKAAGDWRNWFTAPDVGWFRPMFDPLLKQLGYETDWDLPDAPNIKPEYGLSYIGRLIAERREFYGLPPFTPNFEIDRKEPEPRSGDAHQPPMLFDEIQSPSEYILALVHIPKTAGTSLRVFLESFFDPQESIEFYNGDIQQILAGRQDSVRFAAGHLIRWGIQRHFLKSLLLVTVVRHPIDRYVSLYKEARNNTRSPLHQYAHDRDINAFLDFLLTSDIPAAKAQLNNLQCRLVCGEESGAVAAKYIHDHYYLACTIHQVEVLASMIAGAYGKPMNVFPALNVRPSSIDTENLSTESEQRILKSDAQDLELFLSVQRQFDELCAVHRPLKLPVTNSMVRTSARSKSLPMAAGPKKYDIINILNKTYKYKRFLEISTTTTGLNFGAINKKILDICHRVAYNVQNFGADKQAATYRTSQSLSHELLRAIDNTESPNRPYDSIFVDPFHSYASTAIDLAGAFMLLEDGGVIVVHDCNPTNPTFVGREFKRGGWCGLTYAAFIDFVMRRNDLSYYTVNCDFGCGVIFKRPPELQDATLTVTMNRLLFEWEIYRDDDDRRYTFFDQNRKALLNLISAEEFLARMGGSVPKKATTT